MTFLREAGSAAWRLLRGHFRPLLAFHLYFTVLAASALIPAIAWSASLLARMSGPGMLGNAELVRFALTPAGVLVALAALTIGAMYLFVQHAGVIIVAAHRRNLPALPDAAAGLWWLGRNLHRLLALAGCQVLAHGLAAAPFALILVLSFDTLLGDFDPYFVITARPAELWWFGTIAAALLAGMIAVNGHLYVRWILALPSMLLDGYSPRRALAESARLTRGKRLKIGLVAIAVGAAVAGLPALLAAAFGGLADLLLYLPFRAGVLVPAMLLLLAGYVVLSAGAAFASVCMNALVIVHLYQRLGGRGPLQVPERAPRRAGPLAWTLELLVVAFAVLQVGLALSSLDARDLVAVTAHRGSALAAPENTLPAIERAITDGADFVEVDVRQTRDGHLVLSHDKDFLRTAGVASEVWNMSLEEVRRLDVGSHFDPAYAGTRVPTLAEAIAALRGRAGLYLELKPAGPTPDLVSNVVDTLRRERFLARTVVGSLDLGVLREARRLEPRLRTSLLVHTAIGSGAENLYAQALRVGLLDAAAVRRLRSRQQQVHVWTVNDPRTMARCLDLGVDNIITDRPEELTRLLRSREVMPAGRLLLRRLRSLIW